jgi:CDP-diacylglycerol--serine O-phosphatidyltransferase
MATQADKPRHFSMLREFHLADFFTLGNAACGVGSVFLAMLFLNSGYSLHFQIAALLLPLAFILDIFDGRIARARNQYSALGRELGRWPTSFPFGVAPAAPLPPA